MNLDRRLSSALHALLHLGARSEPVTSEELALCMHANPVVLRRTMGGLRDAGLVRSERGRGGGWSLNRNLSAITVCDVHTALGAPSMLAAGIHTRNPECRVERAVNGALEGAVREAEAALLAGLEAVTLAHLAAEVHSHVHIPSHSPEQKV